MYHERNSRKRSRYLVFLVGGLALVAVGYYGVNQHSRPEVVAQATPEQQRAAQGQAPASITPANQASPQGPTGPIETKSGGAPASSPQGDTPSGMQAAPQGSDKAIRSPSK